MFALRARPLYRDADASVDTDGVAFQVYADADHPTKVHQVVVETDARIFVGVGRSQTPPAPTTQNTVYQPTGERVYTLDGNDAEERWLYIYAVTDTAEVFVSRFG